MNPGDPRSERLNASEIEVVLSGHGEAYLSFDELSHETLAHDERPSLTQRARLWISTHRGQSAVIAFVIALAGVASLVAIAGPKTAPPAPITIAVESTGTVNNGATIEFRTISVEINLHDSSVGGPGYTLFTVSGPHITRGRSTIAYVGPGQTVGGILYADVDCSGTPSETDKYEIALTVGRLSDSANQSADRVAIGLGPVEGTWRSLVKKACEEKSVIIG